MKTFLSILLLLAASTSLQAQSLKDLFLKMPQTLCPALNEYNRLEIVDNQKNDKTMQTRNLFKTYSKMETLTDDYALLTVTNNSKKEMKLLTLKDDSKIIMMINTVTADGATDSSVAFYSTDWKPLESKSFFTEAISKDFRKINVDPATSRLTVVTDNSSMFLKNDAVKPAPEAPAPLTTTYAWNREQNKYVKE